MSKIIFCFITVLFSILSIAPGFSNEHSLGAHEHGSIKIGLAIENNTAEIDIDGPAESFVGFEYSPKTTKEKKIFTDAQNQWVKNFNSLITFDKKLNCRVLEASFEQELEAKEAHKTENKEAGVHSDIEAHAKINCKTPIAGSLLTISLKKTFKNIKKLSVEIIGTETKSIEITQESQTIKI